MKALSGYVRLTPAPGATLVAYKAGADLASKSVTLVVTVAAARTLPAADFGVLALGMTTGWLLGVASDAGLPMHLATRVARAQASGAPVGAIVRDAMRWRYVLGAVVLVVAAPIGAALAPAALVPAFILIVAHQLLGAMLETLAHAYRGLGRTDIESSLVLIHRGAVAAGSLAVLAISPSLLGLAVALALPPALVLGVSWAVARRIAADVDAVAAHRPGRDHVVAAERARFPRDVAPLGLGVLLSAIYFRCDVYFLKWLHGVEQVGYYNAAFRLVDALRLLPAAALAVAYPALCRAADLRTLRQLTSWLLAGASAATVVLLVSAPSLLALVYGEAYAVSGGALRVLAIGLPLLFLNHALTSQIVAWERHRAFLAIMAAALAANLAGNTLLIPSGGMIGAAESTVITEVVVLGGSLWALARR